MNEETIEKMVNGFLASRFVTINMGYANQCGPEKSSAILNNGHVFIDLHQGDTDKWEEVLTEAAKLVVKAEEIDGHNRKHPDIFERIRHIVGVKNNVKIKIRPVWAEN